ncbi:VCBS repeat-containing protein [Streptomyces sp. NBC_01717]|uniref:FG-GAP repeat protein n=1 Tax=Streptomyces sp. NBC_01717 TaxID=2975918 RepID=UPI002E321FB3|nr:FG-GAP repeat protein [Streptomyces sp. NBC_01717]
MRLRTTTALAALVAAGLTPLTLPTTPASAGTTKYADDFNGDGYRDLATSAPDATVSGEVGAGAIVVTYGSASGLAASSRTVISQNSASVPGAAEKSDSFGSSLASADLDRDGYADLVVGAEYEDVGTYTDAGSVTVLWGSASGLSGGATLSPPRRRFDKDRSGMSVATGDFDGDGSIEVMAAGNGDLWHMEGPFTRSGTAADTEYIFNDTTRNLAVGDITGNGSDELLMLGGMADDDLGGEVAVMSWDSGEWQNTEIAADGLTGAVGDIDADGYADVVLGRGDKHGNEAKAGIAKGGQITVLHGSPAGLGATRPARTLSQASSGIPGTAETWDGFGDSVAMGDINGDGYADVAVGAPAEGVGDQPEAGAVTVLRGSATGLTTTRAVSFTQNSTAVPGTAENLDSFGSAVRLADLNGNAKADLSIGVAGENEVGGIWYLPGTSTGLTGTKSVGCTATSLGLASAGFPALGEDFAQPR